MMLLLLMVVAMTKCSKCCNRGVRRGLREYDAKCLILPGSGKAMAGSIWASEK